MLKTCMVGRIGQREDRTESCGVLTLPLSPYVSAERYYWLSIIVLNNYFPKGIFSQKTCDLLLQFLI